LHLLGRSPGAGAVGPTGAARSTWRGCFPAAGVVVAIEPLRTRRRSDGGGPAMHRPRPRVTGCRCGFRAWATAAPRRQAGCGASRRPNEVRPRPAGGPRRGDGAGVSTTSRRSRGTCRRSTSGLIRGGELVVDAPNATEHYLITRLRTGDDLTRTNLRRIAGERIATPRATSIGSAALAALPGGAATRRFAPPGGRATAARSATWWAAARGSSGSSTAIPPMCRAHRPTGLAAIEARLRRVAVGGWRGRDAAAEPGRHGGLPTRSTSCSMATPPTLLDASRGAGLRRSGRRP